MPPTRLSPSQQLGAHIVREKQAHDLSRNAELASFPFFGYRTTAAAVELVALCDADGLTEGDIVRRRDEFFELVRTLPHQYGLKPRGRNPNGLLGFVFAGGCTEQMARFIARQTRISHTAGTGGVSVSWAIDVPERRIHTHDNPVSLFPPVLITARTVYPGLDFLESLLDRVEVPVVTELDAAGDADGADEHDVFISYASEDLQVAVAIAQELSRRGLRVWLDKLSILPGDSIRRSIERGLAGSRYGLVLLSRSFFAKESAQSELNGMFARETIEGRNLILPVWHGIDEREIGKHAPILADKFAVRTSDGIPFIAEKLARVLQGSGTTPPMPEMESGGPQPEPEPEPAGRGADDGRIRILFLAANSLKRPLDLGWEHRQIARNLRAAKERDSLELKAVLEPGIDEVMQAMLDESPTIVHFSGHGTPEGITLRNDAGKAQLVSGEALASVFALFPTVKCVVLNACWSEPQAQAIRRHVPHVIGTRNAISDQASLAFSMGFYMAIGAGMDIPFAFQAGLARVRAGGRNADDVIALL